MDNDNWMITNRDKEQKYTKRRSRFLVHVARIPKSDIIIKMTPQDIFPLFAIGTFPSAVKIDPKVPQKK